MATPNLGLNSQVTVNSDYTKCCPRVCKSSCCGSGEPKTPKVSKKIIEEVVKAALSASENYSHQQPSPRRYSDSK